MMLVAVFLTLARGCPLSEADSAAHSLLSADRGLFLRHAGYVAWETPSLTPLDALDSTFVLRPGLAGIASSVSFENQVEFPGYYLMVDPSSFRITLEPNQPGNMTFAAAASFVLRDGLSDPSLCSLESVAHPGQWISGYGSSLPRAVNDTPCHYADCPAVFAIAAPPSAVSPAFAAASTWTIMPPNTGGTTAFTLGGLYLEVDNRTGTISVLRDAHDTSGFSFTRVRSEFSGSHALGDVTLRLRTYGSSNGWTQATTATTVPSFAPQTAPLFPSSVWASNVTPLLNLSGFPSLGVSREIAPAPDGQGAVLLLILSNNNNNKNHTTSEDVLEIGGLDVSMIFNNDWTGLSLEQNAATCSLTDPYIGSDAGYLRVVRITGSGPVLLVAPSPMGCAGSMDPVFCGARFEAWRLIEDDPAPRSVTFEGFYAWSVASLAWAQNEWSQAQPWNPATSIVLSPGQRAVIGFRLWTGAEDVAHIDEALLRAQRPVVRPIPGTVLTPDMQTAQLLVQLPINMTVQQIVADPAPALQIGVPSSPRPGMISVPLATSDQWPQFLGRVRLSLIYATNEFPYTQEQAVHMYVMPPAQDQVLAYANFTSQFAYFDDISEPFGRAFSFMDYDAAEGTVMLQEGRVFVVGLSDEAGAGTALGYAVHAAGRADILAATQLATFVNRTLVNPKPDARGVPVSLQAADGAMRASMFWGPGMPNYTYTVSPCWDEERSLTQWRSYNYPHPTMLLLALYRLVRDNEGSIAASAALASQSNGELDPLQPWEWYLARSALTFQSMWKHCFDISYQLCQYGLMVGSGHVQLLQALQEEAQANATGPWALLAQTVDQIQRNRTQGWASLLFPFGSEMPWDSTGQEEIFVHSQLYGNDLGPSAWRTANLTAAAVHAYTPNVPHWAYHGSARRYFDFGVNGRIVIGPTERALHHYGAGINSVVLLNEFLRFPNTSYAIRTGFAASWAPILAMDVESGAPHMAFHGDASVLDWEPYTADFGINMFGGASGWGCWIEADMQLGGQWVGYGCDVLSQPTTTTMTIVPYDPWRRRVFFGPLGLALTLRSGSIANLTVDLSAHHVTISFQSPPVRLFDSLRLVVDIPTHPDWTVLANVTFASPVPAPLLVRGAYELPYNTSSAVLSWVPLSDASKN